MAEDSGLPFLSSIGLSITARCPIACAHCIIEAGPRRKEEMASQEARTWVEQASAYRRGHIKSVVITGGEPFYNPGLLQYVLNCAISCGLVPIVMTNAFWASSLDVATQILREMPQIRMLNVSTDIYHQKSIPIEKAKNALLAARELGLAASAAVCFEKESDASYQNTRAELATVIDERLIQSSGISPVGRAARFKAEHFETSPDYPVSACTSADCPTVFPDGRVIACMGMVKALPEGHPLYLGNLRDKTLKEILDAAEQNIALHILRLWGPGRLLKMLEQAGVRHRLPVRYSKCGCCELCYALAADPGLINILLDLTADAALAEKIAYARLFYLNEEAVLSE